MPNRSRFRFMILQLIGIGRQETGSVALIVAVAMIGMAGILALTVDVGVGYANRRALQNAVDAAALAGTREVMQANGDGAVMGAINGMLDSNQIDPSRTVEVTYISGGPSYTELGAAGNGIVPSGAGGVKVKVSVAVDTLFAPVINQDQMNISAVASASVFPPALAPIAVNEFAGFKPTGNQPYPDTNDSYLNPASVKYGSPFPILGQGSQVWNNSDPAKFRSFINLDSRSMYYFNTHWKFLKPDGTWIDQYDAGWNGTWVTDSWASESAIPYIKQGGYRGIPPLVVDSYTWSPGGAAYTPADGNDVPYYTIATFSGNKAGDAIAAFTENNFQNGLYAPGRTIVTLAYNGALTGNSSSNPTITVTGFARIRLLCEKKNGQKGTTDCKTNGQINTLWGEAVSPLSKTLEDLASVEDIRLVQ